LHGGGNAIWRRRHWLRLNNFCHDSGYSMRA
jgi:hypothetical protein